MYGGLTFDERFQLLVEVEWLDRKERRVKRRLQQAKLKQRAACLEDVDYTCHRGLERKVIDDLATCYWIRNGRNVILNGATGVGKTWPACALSNRACREGLSLRYYRVSRLAHELTLGVTESF